MSPSKFVRRGFAGISIFVWIFSNQSTPAATIVAGAGESGFRAAISAAQDGDTVMLTNHLQLQATVGINKPITITVDPGEAWRISIEARFDGAMLELSTNGIVLDGLKLYGSPLTDALRAEDIAVTLRDCTIDGCRRPLVSVERAAHLRLERVTVSNNQEGINAQSLVAKDCTFSGNGGWAGAGAWTAELDHCVIEGNRRTGLYLINGTVKNCVFRYNTEFALWFDPDNGYLNLKSCLFYANSGGGAYLGEGGYATVDNCTFTRHTGGPAVFVTTDAHDIHLRHCTVADNVALGSDPPHWLSPPAAFWIGSNARLENCLIADNPTGNDLHASGLVGDWTDGGGNVIGGPAHLSALLATGGPTLSLLPLSGSPAIDAGRASDVVRDARGLSRIAGTAPDAGAVETGAAAPADTDADGLPDTWERFHGLNPDNPADASSDSDGDGQTARAEFGSGTDPADRQSVHRVEEVSVGPMSIHQPYPRWGYLSWTRHPGVFYYVEGSNDLRTWHRLPDSGSPGGPTLWWNIGLIEADSPSTFYRVIATME